MVCSCHDVTGFEDLPDDGVQEVSFTGDGKDWGDPDRADTRATDGSWTANDSIGIYMQDADATGLAEARKKNRKYVITDAARGKLSPAPGQTLYYPAGNPVRFTAYYPYASAAATANRLTFTFTDQRTQGRKEALDFAFHKDTKTYRKGDGQSVSMRFKHQFAKIRMTVKKGESDTDCTDMAVTLSGMPATATVDLAKLNGSENDSLTAITTSGTTVINAYTVSSTDTEAVVEAIIAPHTGRSGRVITFTNRAGEERAYLLPEDTAFEGGMVYLYAFDLAPIAELYDGGAHANCYMVVPGDDVTFDVKRAYRYVKGAHTEWLHTGGKYAGEFEVGVIWDDNSVIASAAVVPGKTGKETEITVTTNAATGNAVVGLYKKDETTPVWSYHIWVTDPDDIQDWPNTNHLYHTYTFMDRNLGATEAALSLAGRGLFYQWGRKDPFPGGKSGTAGYAAKSAFKGINAPNFSNRNPVTILKDAGVTAGIITSIENPTTFLGRISSGNWLPKVKNDLWNASGGTKTIYDPCPKGWRIPVDITNPTDVTYNPFDKLVPRQNYSEGDTAGFYNSTTTKKYSLPCCGAIESSNYKYTDVGIRIYYQTANTINTGILIYTAIVADHSPYIAVANQSYGYSVRCVRET
jgi:hypothetical protein